MSEVNPTDQVVEQKLKEATGADVSIKQMDALNNQLFENLYRNLYRELMSDSTITKKNVVRAVFKAMALGTDVDDTPTLQNETEAKIGGFFAQLSDKRMLVLERKFREQTEKERQEVEAKIKEEQNQGESN
jgi:hypothetical protein